MATSQSIPCFVLITVNINLNVQRSSQLWHLLKKICDSSINLVNFSQNGHGKRWHFEKYSIQWDILFLWDFSGSFSVWIFWVILGLCGMCPLLKNYEIDLYQFYWLLFLLSGHGFPSRMISHAIATHGNLKQQQRNPEFWIQSLTKGVTELLVTTLN